MYKSFYGFHLKPFEHTPDPKFLFLSVGMQETLATLEYGIIQKRGFMLLVGDPGTGKTTLINSLMEKSDINADCAYIFNPDLNFYEILHTVLVEFYLASEEEELSKTKAMQRLNSFLVDQYKKNRNTVIIIDEAQTLDTKTLETLRLLSNFELHTDKLLQIIIAGQPGLLKTLNQESLTQLSQRFGLRCRTAAFSEKETYEYIIYRLKKSGCSYSQLFSEKAKHIIWSYTKGNPRIINIVCDNSLLSGYSSGKNRIDSFIVKEAIADLKKLPLSSIDYHENEFKEMMFEKNQTPFEKSVEISKVSAESSKKSDNHTSDKIDSIRLKLILAEESKQTEKRKKRLSFAEVYIIAFISAATFFGVYFLAADFIKTQKESFSRLEVIKENEYDQSNIEKITEFALPSTQQHLKLNVDGNADIDNDEQIIIAKDKSVSDENTSASSSDNDKAEIPKFILVRKGETIDYIISKVYGETNPKIIEAILKINPDIKNTDFFYENQIIKLPQKNDLD